MRCQLAPVDEIENSVRKHFTVWAGRRESVADTALLCLRKSASIDVESVHREAFSPYSKNAYVFKTILKQCEE